MLPHFLLMDKCFIGKLNLFLFFSRASQPRTAQLVNEEKKCAVCFFLVQSRLILNGDYGHHSDRVLPHGGLRGTVYCLMILFAHRISEDLTVT